MRVSERMKSYNLLGDINRTMSRMLKTQQDLATTTTIHKPSDDPGGTTRLMQVNGALKRNERYQKNVEDASEQLLTTEAAVTGVMDLINLADNLLLQASNDTLGADERRTLAEQMEVYWIRSIDLGNQEFADRYIFGGTNNATRPYSQTNQFEDETFTSVHDTAVNLGQVGLTAGSVTVTSSDGSVTYAEGTDYTIDYDNGTLTALSTGTMADATDFLVSYETDSPSGVVLNPNGVDGQISRVIDEGVQMTVNFSATEVFGDQNDLQNTLRSAYNALMRNDAEAFGDLRTELTSQRDVVTGKLGQIGTKINALTLQQEKLEADNTNYQKLVSSIEDTNMAEAMVQLEQDQAIYEASLQVSAQLIKNTLLDYL